MSHSTRSIYLKTTENGCSVEIRRYSPLREVCLVFEMQPDETDFLFMTRVLNEVYTRWTAMFPDGGALSEGEVKLLEEQERSAAAYRQSRSSFGSF